MNHFPEFSHPSCKKCGLSIRPEEVGIYSWPPSDSVSFPCKYCNYLVQVPGSNENTSFKEDHVTNPQLHTRTPAHPRENQPQRAGIIGLTSEYPSEPGQHHDREQHIRQENEFENPHPENPPSPYLPPGYTDEDVRQVASNAQRRGRRKGKTSTDRHRRNKRNSPLLHSNRIMKNTNRPSRQRSQQQESQSPEQESQSPEQESQSSEQESQSPLDQSQIPFNQSQNPVERIYRSWIEVKPNKDKKTWNIQPPWSKNPLWILEGLIHGSEPYCTRKAVEGDKFIASNNQIWYRGLFERFQGPCEPSEARALMPSYPATKNTADVGYAMIPPVPNFTNVLDFGAQTAPTFATTAAVAAMTAPPTAAPTVRFDGGLTDYFDLDEWIDYPGDTPDLSPSDILFNCEPTSKGKGVDDGYNAPS